MKRRLEERRKGRIYGIGGRCGRDGERVEEETMENRGKRRIWGKRYKRKCGHEESRERRKEKIKKGEK